MLRPICKIFYIGLSVALSKFLSVDSHVFKKKKNDEVSKEHLWKRFDFSRLLFAFHLSIALHIIKKKEWKRIITYISKNHSSGLPYLIFSTLSIRFVVSLCKLRSNWDDLMMILSFSCYKIRFQKIYLYKMKCTKFSTFKFIVFAIVFFFSSLEMSCWSNEIDKKIFYFIFEFWKKMSNRLKFSFVWNQ